MAMAVRRSTVNVGPSTVTNPPSDPTQTTTEAPTQAAADTKVYSLAEVIAALKPLRDVSEAERDEQAKTLEAIGDQFLADLEGTDNLARFCILIFTTIFHHGSVNETLAVMQTIDNMVEDNPKIMIRKILDEVIEKL